MGICNLHLPAVSKTTTGGPVELENAVGVGHGGTVQRESLSSGGRGSEVHKAVASIAPTTNIRTLGIIEWGMESGRRGETMVVPRELVTDHLNVDLFTHLEPQVADEVLVNPGLELSHPAVGYWLDSTLIQGGP